MKLMKLKVFEWETERKRKEEWKEEGFSERTKSNKIPLEIELLMYSDIILMYYFFPFLPPSKATKSTFKSLSSYRYATTLK